MLTAKFLHRSIVKRLGLGQTQHFATLLVVEKLAMLVEQLKRIPLLGIVRSGDDNATTRFLPHHCKFGGGSRGQTDVHHVKTHAGERTHYQIEHHATAQAGITAYDYHIALHRTVVTHILRIGRGKLDDVQRSQAITSRATNGATNSRYRLD